MPDVLVQRLKELIDMLGAVGTQVRHQQVSIVERRQVVVGVTDAEITQLTPTTANITAWQHVMIAHKYSMILCVKIRKICHMTN